MTVHCSIQIKAINIFANKVIFSHPFEIVSLFIHYHLQIFIFSILFLRKFYIYIFRIEFHFLVLFNHKKNMLLHPTLMKA